MLYNNFEYLLKILRGLEDTNKAKCQLDITVNLTFGFIILFRLLFITIRTCRPTIINKVCRTLHVGTADGALLS